MTVKEALNKAVAELHRVRVPSPHADAEWLLAHLLKCSRTEVYLHRNRKLSEGEINHLMEMLYQRLKRRPLAYILGHWDFMGLRLKVDERAMIPRPETEQLVERVIEMLRSTHPCGHKLLIADVGTGSGAIAIALAMHFPTAQIFAIDRSAKALELALENAKAHHVDEHISFLNGLLLEPLQGHIPFNSLDAVVANLPYVSDDEIDHLPPEVADYEPIESWYGGSDGLLYIRSLIEQAPKWLCSGGLIALEVGARQANAVTDLIGAACEYERIEAFHDYAGILRHIFAWRK